MSQLPFPSELAQAARVLNDARADDWMRAATSWAKTNTEAGGDAILSGYDVSELSPAKPA